MSMFYIAAPPERLPILPLPVRLAMQPELCSVCGGDVYVHDRCYLETLFACGDLTLICEPCNDVGKANHAGPVQEALAVPSTWQGDLHNPELN